MGRDSMDGNVRDGRDGEGMEVCWRRRRERGFLEIWPVSPHNANERLLLQWASSTKLVS